MTLGPIHATIELNAMLELVDASPKTSHFGVSLYHMQLAATTAAVAAAARFHGRSGHGTLCE